MRGGSTVRMRLPRGFIENQKPSRLRAWTASDFPVIRLAGYRTDFFSKLGRVRRIAASRGQLPPRGSSACPSKGACSPFIRERSDASLPARRLRALDREFPDPPIEILQKGRSRPPLGCEAGATSICICRGAIGTLSGSNAQSRSARPPGFARSHKSDGLECGAVGEEGCASWHNGTDCGS